MGHHKEKCCKSKCKKSKKCDRKKGCDCNSKPKCECPLVNQDCIGDCDQMSLPTVINLLGPVSTPILMIQSGTASSPARTLVIEALVSPVAPSVVPAFATFFLTVDGVPLDPSVRVEITQLEAALPAGNARSTAIRATVTVGPGVHTIQLLGSSNNPVVLRAGDGTALSVYEKIDCCDPCSY